MQSVRVHISIPLWFSIYYRKKEAGINKIGHSLTVHVVAINSTGCNKEQNTHTRTLGMFQHAYTSSPLEHISDQEQEEGAGQNSREVGHFSINTTLVVLQVGPGDVPRQPQAIPPHPLTDRPQHGAEKRKKTHTEIIQLHNHITVGFVFRLEAISLSTFQRRR